MSEPPSEPMYQEVGNSGLYLCSRCGSATTLEGRWLHTRWHQRQEDAR
jgi:hypothetical protein